MALILIEIEYVIDNANLVASKLAPERTSNFLRQIILHP
jgi:predicted cation transporter